MLRDYEAQRNEIEGEQVISTDDDEIVDAEVVPSDEDEFYAEGRSGTSNFFLNSDAWGFVSGEGNDIYSLGSLNAEGVSGPIVEKALAPARLSLIASRYLRYSHSVRLEPDALYHIQLQHGVEPDIEIKMVNHSETRLLFAHRCMWLALSLIGLCWGILTGITLSVPAFPIDPTAALVGAASVFVLCATMFLLGT